jgi:hypothetical protein
MARKDDIFKSFINHSIISEKYGIDNTTLPNTLREGLVSEHVIIQTIALIVDSQESIPAESNKALETKVRQFLQKEAI